MDSTGTVAAAPADLSKMTLTKTDEGGSSATAVDTASPSTSASSPGASAKADSKGGASPPATAEPAADNKSTSSANVRIPVSSDNRRMGTSEDIHRVLSFGEGSPKENDDRKRHALELRLRTVQDILMSQNEDNERILAFCADAHRWMVEADAIMRQNNIAPPLPPPTAPPRVQSGAGMQSTPAGSPTVGGNFKTTSRSFGNRNNRGEQPRPYGASASGDIDVDHSADASTVILSLLRPGNAREHDRQMYQKHQHMMGPRHAYHGPVDWECDSENEDFGGRQNRYNDNVWMMGHGGFPGEWPGVRGGPRRGGGGNSGWRGGRAGEVGAASAMKSSVGAKKSDKNPKNSNTRSTSEQNASQQASKNAKTEDSAIPTSATSEETASKPQAKTTDQAGSAQDSAAHSESKQDSSTQVEK